MFIYDSFSYRSAQKIEGEVVRTYIEINDDTKSNMLELRFGNVINTQSISRHEFSLIKPGDKLLVRSGKMTGAWMAADLYRSNQLIVKNLTLNRGPILFFGILLFIWSLWAFMPRLRFGVSYSIYVKQPIIVSGCFSFLFVLYYAAKMLTV